MIHKPTRKNLRWLEFDYTGDAMYFVTSVTYNRECFFGSIKAGKMYKSTAGQYAERQWFWLAEQYSHVILHDFVVMPNHIHGIIETRRDTADMVDGWGSVHSDTADRSRPVPTGNSLSKLMGAYKTTTSKAIHLAGHTDFRWQRSFHDRVIRNNDEFNLISEYIKTNPEKWQSDRFSAS